LIRKPNINDLDQIVKLRETINGGNSCYPRTRDFYHWKYFGNPVQDACVRIAVDGNSIIGIVAATYRSIKLNNDIVLCAELGDLFTHPHYRRQGIFTNLCNEVINEVEKKGVKLIYVRPNENSYRILIRKMGFKDVFRLKTFYYPIDIKAVLKEKIKNSILFQIGYPIVKVGTKVIFKKGKLLENEEIKIIRVNNFEEDVNKLWEEVSKNWNVILVRDEKYLEWRYIKSPIEFAVFFAKKKDTTVGYMVVVENNFKRGHIVDFLCMPDEPGVALSLITKAINYFKRENIEIVTTWVNDRGSTDDIFINSLCNMGFRSYGKKLHFIIRSNIINIDNFNYEWFFRIGDIDGI